MPRKDGRGGRQKGCPAPRSAFKKGQSGNPAGRKPVPEDVKEALKAMHLPAVRRLDELLHSTDEKVAIRAVEIVLERNMGRVPQPIEMNDARRRQVDLSKLNDAQLAEYEKLTALTTVDELRPDAGGDSGGTAPP